MTKEHKTSIDRVNSVGELFDELPEYEKIKIARLNRERKNRYGNRKHNSAYTGRRAS